MSAARGPLRLIDGGTGEIVSDDHVQALRDQIAGLERDIRGWRARYADLKRDKTAEARAHKLWPEVVELFQHWQRVCHHPKSAFTADRFWLAMPFVERHGVELVRRAIDGAAFDPYVTRRKNGTTKRHDDWGLIFRDQDKFENFANRAPIPRSD